MSKTFKACSPLQILTIYNVLRLEAFDILSNNFKIGLNTNYGQSCWVSLCPKFVQNVRESLGLLLVARLKSESKPCLPNWKIKFNYTAVNFLYQNYTFQVFLYIYNGKTL